TLVTLADLLARQSLVLCKSGAFGVGGRTLMAADAEKPSTVAEALPCAPADPADHVVDPADELSRNPLAGFTVPLTPEKLIATPVGLGKPNPEVLLELVLMLAEIVDMPVPTRTELGAALTLKTRCGSVPTVPETTVLGVLVP